MSTRDYERVDRERIVKEIARVWGSTKGKPDMAFVCSATWVAKEGEAHKVAEALKHLSPASRTEEGNLYYQAYQDPAEPNTFRIFEIYKDEAAFKQHAEYDHFKEWALGLAIPALEVRQRDFYETLDF